MIVRRFRMHYTLYEQQYVGLCITQYSSSTLATVCRVDFAQNKILKCCFRTRNTGHPAKQAAILAGTQEATASITIRCGWWEQIRAFLAYHQ